MGTDRTRHCTRSLHTSLAASLPSIAAVYFVGLMRRTGAQLWSRQLSGQSFTSPPTAMGGTVYVNGFPTLYAVSTQDGTIIWSAPNAGGEHSSPAVTTTAVYVSRACDGRSRCHHLQAAQFGITTSSCFGAGGRTPVFYNSRVYIRNNDIGNVALDAGTGHSSRRDPDGAGSRISWLHRFLSQHIHVRGEGYYLGRTEMVIHRRRDS